MFLFECINDLFDISLVLHLLGYICATLQPTHALVQEGCAGRDAVAKVVLWQTVAVREFGKEAFKPSNMILKAFDLTLNNASLCRASCTGRF